MRWLVSFADSHPVRVTSVMDVLALQGYRTDGLLLIGLNSAARESRESTELLLSHLRRHHTHARLEQMYVPRSHRVFTEDLDEAAVWELMRALGLRLALARDAGHEVMVDIGGATPAMATMAALMGSLFGISRLFRFSLADDELEAGHIRQISRLSRGEADTRLHPLSRETGVQWVLADIPIISTQGLVAGVLDGLRGGRTSARCRSLLQSSGFMCSDGSLTTCGHHMLAVLEQVDDLPRPWPRSTRVAISTAHQRVDPTAPRYAGELAEMLPYVRSVRSLRLQHGKRSVRPPSERSCSWITITTQSPPVYAFAVHTTARTDRQRQAMLRALPFVDMHRRLAVERLTTDASTQAGRA